MDSERPGTHLYLSSSKVWEETYGRRLQRGLGSNETGYQAALDVLWLKEAPRTCRGFGSLISKKYMLEREGKEGEK